MNAVVGQEFDGLIVQVDASMAHNVKVEAACPPARATTDPLREIILADWLGLSSPPQFLVLATPSKTIDAWVVGALEPHHPNLECDLAIENVLVRLGKLRKSDGQVKKARDRYERLAEAVGSRLSGVREACTEAERFASDLERFRPTLL